MTIPAEQHDVVDFLTGLSGGPPQETHISAVFTGADTVWKLKKAVRMPFLDFTTLQAREHFLRRELEINQSAAPGLYRDVVAIVRDQTGAPQFAQGEPIDFVLRMARIPPQDFLETIASDGRLSTELQDALGDAIAAYHAGLEPLYGQDPAAAMLRITHGNAESARVAGLPETEIESWRNRMVDAIEAHRPWLVARSTAGFIRRCHGDLHLGNICLWNGKPVPFDALEFDEALATIDLGYDFAFLLMDLHHRIGSAAANRVMNRYVARTGDVGLLTGLPFFLSQRAMIRAHVLQAIGKDGSAYLAAAQTYLTLGKSRVLAIGGLQGTGKSTLARALAPELGPPPGALILRSDEIRKRLFGHAPEARLPPDAYSAAANARTNAVVIEQARIAAATGYTVIIDATFLDPVVRRDLAAAMADTGAPVVGIWLQAPLPVLEARIAARTADASDATIEVLRRSAASRPSAGDWLAVDATDAAGALAIVRTALLNAPG